MTWLENICHSPFQVVFLSRCACCQHNVMPTESKEIKSNILAIKVLLNRPSEEQKKVQCQKLYKLFETVRLKEMVENLLVFWEKVGRLKEFGPFCFPLKNLVCDTEAWSPHGNTINENSTFKDKQVNLFKMSTVDINTPYLNSSLMMVRVDVDTLYVEFCWG